MDGESAGPGKRELIEEACRLVDRLDRLDDMLRDHKAWLTFAANDSSVVVMVYVDKALSEARQQQVALKQILAELRQSAAVGTVRPPATGGSGLVSGVADLSARIAARRGTPAG